MKIKPSKPDKKIVKANKDLDQAVENYCWLLNFPAPTIEELPGRQVRTARFRLGESWLILVQPLNQDSVPGRHLAQHGEGFFLLSLQTDDLDSDIRRVRESGGKTVNGEPRQGLDNWRVQDLDPANFSAVSLQLTEEE